MRIDLARVCVLAALIACVMPACGDDAASGGAQGVTADATVDTTSDVVADTGPGADTVSPPADVPGDTARVGDTVPPEDVTPDSEPDSEPDTEPDSDVEPVTDADASDDGDTDDTDDDTASDVMEDTAPPGEAFDPGEVPVDTLGFPLGLMSAEVTDDGALLWTRYTGDDELFALVFADGQGNAPGLLLADVPAPVSPDGFVEVDVDGLPPFTRVRYVFVTRDGLGFDDQRSPIGRFRTAPEPDALEALVFGGTSCIEAEFFPLTPLQRAAEDDLDFFLFAGDTVYADGSVSLEEYREVWADWFSEPEFAALHASTGSYATWDDHEVDNNWDPETLDPAHLDAATQAYFEHTPTRKVDGVPRIWRSYRWGKTLEVFVLDCRSERLPSTKSGDDAQYISPDQLAWLQQGLVASDAVFKVVLNSVPITNMPPIYLSQADRWEGYAAQREALLGAMSEIDGVLFVSGDFHLSAIGGIEPPGSPLDTVPEVFMGPAAQFPNPLWAILNSGFFADQFSYLGGTNNYVRFIADPLADPPAITIHVVDGAGDVIHAETRYF